MITFQEICQVFSIDLKRKYCIEIQFSVLGSEKFISCWMGKMPDRKTKQDIYWFGLTDDGQNAYDYSTFEEMSEAKVFDGKSLKDIWVQIVLLSIDG